MKDPTHVFEGEVSPRQILIARVISVITQPTIITIPTFAVLCTPLLPDLWAYAFAVFVTTLMITVIPTLNVYYFSWKTNNKDGDIVKREERIIPMIVGLGLYFLAAIVIWFIEAPQIVKIFAWVYPVSTTIVGIISTKWKISIHMTGVAGPVTTLGFFAFPWGWLTAILFPIVAWARYVQKKHTPAQLICGAVEGIIVTSVMLVLLL